MHLNLPSVTLACIGSDHIQEAVLAVRRCIGQCDFAAVVHLPDIIDNTNNPHEQYNDFVINKLHKFIQTSHCLIIQWDGFILNAGAWDNKWLEYDYIGAPWGLDDPDGVGNGGFSMRSKKLMELMADLNLPPKECRPEDTVICKTYRSYLVERGCVFAPVSEAAKFSVETNGHHPNIKYDGQFGFHNIYTNGVKEFTNKKFSNE